MTYLIDRCPSEESPRLGAMALHPTPESVPRARRWFRKFIAPYNPLCSVDDCTLMISELLTNAILYGRPDEKWVVRVEWFREGTALRV
jgi:anti-sigma regulatory factor (Ser/Thr protein kinase)